MRTLLVITTGQTDVQLVNDDKRSELDRDCCAALHREIEGRTDWETSDSPVVKLKETCKELPGNAFQLCTPKLDAVVEHLRSEGASVVGALILETQREPESEPKDPRAAGVVIERRLKQKLPPMPRLARTAYLTGKDRLEGKADPTDAILRRGVVACIDGAIRSAIMAQPLDQIVVSATGGAASVASLVEEIVRLYAPQHCRVDSLEVSDGARNTPPTHDRAVSRRIVPEPAESYRVRTHVLNLVTQGNLLGAWGACQHLHAHDSEREWTDIVMWLSQFAASLPIAPQCDLPLMGHPLLSARSAIRVELALRNGDVPRAIHGTVSFFEAAIWDWLRHHHIKSDGMDGTDRVFELDPIPVLRGDNNPFRAGSQNRYKISNFGKRSLRIVREYCRSATNLNHLANAVSTVQELRNEVAHSEPKPEVIDDAKKQMVAANLWSSYNTFLSQPLVQDVLRDLQEPHPERLCDDLVGSVRDRLLRCMVSAPAEEDQKQ
jgi:hypothetical protein